MANVPFSLRINDELKARLEAEARQLDRPASYVATKAIESYLARCEAKRHAISQAIAEADKGIFISSDKMTAWVNTWGTDQENNLPEPDIFSNKK